jgi:uncharacterized membrane protein
MPFALLAIALTMNLYLGGAQGKINLMWIEIRINWFSFLVAGLIIGGLAFLNTWDFPIYVVLFSLVYAGYRIRVNHQVEITHEDESERVNDSEGYSVRNTSIFELVIHFLSIAFPLSIVGILLYLPFYAGFSSQAGGILPNLVFPTRGIHLWVMFGSLLIPIILYMIFGFVHLRDRFNFGRGLIISAGLILSLWLISLGFGTVLSNVPLLGNIFMSSIGGGSNSDLIAESLSRRFPGFTLVTLLILLSFAVGYFYRLLRPAIHEKEKNMEGVPETSFSNSGERNQGNYLAHDFVLILILMGGLLVLFVEFFYLRDQFGSRMNTIFKFYFQTWIFWGLAAAFGAGILLKRLSGVWNIMFRVGLGILLIVSLSYPLLSLWNKTNGFNPAGEFTLDGTAYLERSSPEEMAGINWLKNAPAGVVVEAVGPQYSEYARVATNSGQPNVLGWAGHESQWRGGRKEIGTREEDIEAIYSSNNWERTSLLIDMYEVRYVFIGPLERRTYGVNETKFEQFLGEPVFELDQVVIYEIPRG